MFEKIIPAKNQESDSQSFGQSDPDRFSPQNVKARDRRHYLPFAGGSRSCIGEHFARLETTLALATIVRSLRVSSRESEFPVDVPFTTVAHGPIPAHVTPRR